MWYETGNNERNIETESERDQCRSALRVVAALYLNHMTTSWDYKTGFNNSINAVRIMIWKPSFGNETPLLMIIIQSGKQLWQSLCALKFNLNSWHKAHKLGVSTVSHQASQCINNFLLYSTPITFHESSAEHLKSAPWLSAKSSTYPEMSNTIKILTSKPGTIWIPPQWHITNDQWLKVSYFSLTGCVEVCPLSRSNPFK